MAKKVLVQQFRGLRTIHVEDGATVGATLGVNVFNPDGSLATALGGGTTTIVNNPVSIVSPGLPSTGDYVTADQLIRTISAIADTGITLESDTFDLSILNSTTLRVGAISGVYFESLLSGYPIIELPQHDIALSTISLPADGNYIRYVGVDFANTVYWSSQPFASSPTILQLGAVFVQRVAGVNSFMPTYLGNSGVFSKPMLASVDKFAMQMLPNIEQLVNVYPNANLTFRNSEGKVNGLSINWHEQQQAGFGVHQIDVPGNAIMPFTPMNAGIANGGAVPPQVTLVDPTRYWNGSSLVALSSNVRASVQRLLVTWRGILIVQYGEAEYASFDDAVSAIAVAPFTGVFPEGGATEILRMAMKKTCVNLQDVNSCVIRYGASGAGGSSPGSGSVTSVQGIAPIVITGSPAAAPIVGLSGTLAEFNASLTDNDFAPINNPVFITPSGLGVVTINSQSGFDSDINFQDGGTLNGQIAVKADGSMRINNGAGLVPAIYISPTSTSVGVVNGVVDIVARDAAQASPRLSFLEETYTSIKGQVFWDRATDTIKIRRTGGATLTVGLSNISSDLPILAPRVVYPLAVVNITAQYILTETDLGQSVVKSGNGTFAVFCNDNAISPFRIGGTVVIVNRGNTTGNITLTAANGAVLYYPGGSSSGGSGALVIAPGESKTVLKVDTQIWNVI
jgi:hypothetical protein